MNYELAKRLKKTGFPFKVVSDGTIDETVIHFGDTVIYSIPTLEELIEACGNCDFVLAQHRQEKWGCSANNEMVVTTGVTPTEAVANLWLKLHEKA